MPEPTSPDTAPDGALDEVRASVTSDDALITAVVDGTGRLTELTFDPKAMRRDSAELAETVRRTVERAWDDARTQAAQRLEQAAPALPDQEQLMGMLGELQSTATSKLDEMSAALDALIDRTEGRQ